MTCTPFSWTGPDGRKTTGFICSRGRRGRKCSEPGCGRESTALCDFELAGKRKGKTCDRPICDAHRVEQAETNADGGRRDYCQAHAARAIEAVTSDPAPGDPFIDAVKRGSAKLAAGEKLPWWALVTAAAAMRASPSWTDPPPAIAAQVACAGEIGSTS